MKPLHSFALSIILAASSAATRAACTAPQAPSSLPDGKTATVKEMLGAREVVKQYDAATNEYVACLQAEGEAAGAQIDQDKGDAKEKEERKKKLAVEVVGKQNAAVDADNALAGRFNEQLRIFKARDADKK